VILSSDAQLILIDRSKWNEKRLLRFDLTEILNRREVSTLQATATLLHRQSICPEEGLSLLDTLDENSHKHAFGVSEDLKYALREAIELLGNEAVWYLREKVHEKVFGRDLARQLTRECLRYMYRLLFLFYIEARPELGYVPMKSDAFRLGYSLESLRDLELVKLTTEESKTGTFIHESLQLLFEMIYNGFPPGTGQQLAIDNNPEHHIFWVPPLRSHLFDPARTPILNRVTFRNQVLHRVINLMSLSRPKNRRERRGRISYAQLGINQLGAVYEALLSYQGFFAETDLYEVKKAGESYNELETAYFVKADALEQYTEEEKVYHDDGTLRKYPKGTFIYRLAGRDREKSASYYTPEVLTRCLVKYALKELLKDKTADDILQLTVCEPAMGSAAFLNEAINQLAEAYLRLKQKELGRTISHEDYTRERQKVKMYLADNNVFGVDLNPVAVELAEVSLWLNTIHKGAFVPWFGMQLVTGNSLIGARRQVYASHLLSRSSRSASLWLDEAPQRVMPGEKPPKHTVYHFLLPDRGMADYKDRVVRRMAETEIKKIKEWRKDFIKPFTEGEIKRLEALSAAVDHLWEKHIEQQRIISARTSDPIQVFGQPVPEGKRKLTTTEWKDRVFYQEMLSKDIHNSSLYRRLKLTMDYWCALWFWPIEKADLLPSREEFFLELTLILEGNVFDRVYGHGEQMSLFPDTRPKQLTLKLVDEFGHVDADRLCRDSARLGLVIELAVKYRFLHWELQFADIFTDRGGFDLVLGNPPWIKVEWNEGGVMGDAEPLYVLRKYSASKLAQMRDEMIKCFDLRSGYLTAHEEADATQRYLNAYQNYPILKGIQTNLFKCFIPQSWIIGRLESVSAFLHPEGIYDDPKGGLFREQIYRRLCYHFQFINVKKLFAEILHWVTYSINIYSNKIKNPHFYHIANLFHPQTINVCFEHDGNGLVGGIKDNENNWNLKGHKDRIVEVDQKKLTLFASLYDDKQTSSLQARLPAVHSQQIVSVLVKFAAHPNRLGDLKGNYYPTVMFDETNAQRDGTIYRKTSFPNTINEWILSGPHFYVGAPLYKSPNKICEKHHDYSVIDLLAIPDDYLPRTNYMPACDPAEYLRRTPLANWGENQPVINYYRLVARKMLSQSGERTLIAAIMPPKVGHIDSCFSIAFKNTELLLRFAAACFSLPYDFFVKTTGKSNLRNEIAKQFVSLSLVYSTTIQIRVLILSCLTSLYSVLWSKCWKETFLMDHWTKEDRRLDNKKFSILSSQWKRNFALRTDYERRQALLEIDVLAAMALGLRDLENTKLPVIMFSYCKKGGTAYEDINFGSEWSIARTGGLDFAFGRFDSLA